MATTGHPTVGRTAGPAGTGTDAERGPGAGRGGLLAVLPEVVGVALTAVSLVAVAALLAGAFRPVVVLPAGALAALAAVLVALPRLRPVHDRRRSRVLADAGALLVAVGFVAANAPYTAQDVWAWRDMGTYTVAGEWLVKHASLPIYTHPWLFTPFPAPVHYTSLGFQPDPHYGYVYAQGTHLLPALLAVGSWLGGDSLFFRVNLLLAAAGLLAVYGLGRRLAHPLFALAATAGLAATLPLAWLARNTLTEPLALAVGFTGFLLLWEGHARRDRVLLGLGGAAIGVLAMTRIDGLFTELSLLPYATVVLAGAVPERRRAALGDVAAVLGAAVPGTVLGVADMRLKSMAYWADHQRDVHPIELAAVVLAVLGAALVALAWHRAGVRAGLGRAGRRLALPAAVLVVAAAGVIASRPAWYVGHAGSASSYVAFLQQAAQLPVRPTRSYSELTLDWIGWYTGWLAVGLGVLGLALLVAGLLRRPRPAPTAFLFALVSTAGLYLLDPQITPDQPWAVRRLVPVVVPGVYLCAAALLTRLVGWGRRRLPAAVPAGVAGAAAVGLVAWPAAVLAPVYTARDGYPLLAQVRAVCAATGPRAALLTTSALGDTYQQTLRSFCDVPAEALDVTPTPSVLAPIEARVARNGRQLYLLAADPTQLARVAPAHPRPYSVLPMGQWNATLVTPTVQGGVTPETVFLDRVGADGRVTPVPGSGPFTP